MLMTPTIIKVAKYKSYYKCVVKLKPTPNQTKPNNTMKNEKIGDCQIPSSSSKYYINSCVM